MFPLPLKETLRYPDCHHAEEKQIKASVKGRRPGWEDGSVKCSSSMRTWVPTSWNPPKTKPNKTDTVVHFWSYFINAQFALWTFSIFTLLTWCSLGLLKKKSCYVQKGLGRKLHARTLQRLKYVSSPAPHPNTESNNLLIKIDTWHLRGSYSAIA